MVRVTTSVKIDEDLWVRFKAKCAIEKVEMSEALEKIIEKELNKQ